MLEELQAGLERLDIQAEQALCTAYLRYIELLAKWNTAYNLTAVKEPEGNVKASYSGFFNCTFVC